MPIKPKLGSFDLSMIVVSLVIGIGIFRTPGMIASTAETPTIFFLAWILGGLVSLFGALTYAEIGSRYAVPGGFYKIFSYCYHPAYAFMINWVLVLTYGAGAAGVMIIGVEYLAPVAFPESWQSTSGINIFVVVLTILLGIINYLGIKTGSRIQNLLSIIKVTMICGLCIGIFYTGNSEINPVEYTYNGSFISVLGISLITVFYTYGGYQQTMNFGGDVKNPQKNMAKGITIGIFIIVTLYLLINYAYYNTLTFQGLKDSKLVAADMAAVIFGESGYTIISIMIFISVVGFANVTIMSNPRVYYAMAEDGILPKIFASVNKKTQVQEVALLAFLGIIVFSVFLLGTFEKIVSYVMSIDTIALATSAGGLFILRKRKVGEENKGLFKIPFYPILPLVFIGFLAVVFINVLINDTEPALFGLGLFILGLPLFYLIKYFNKDEKKESKSDT